MSKSPVLLIILDGWGVEKPSSVNAIHAAHTPHWDKLWNRNPHATLHCGGEAVGLPQNQMGNSEVGHLTMGAGRVIDQELTRINKAIHSGSFFDNPVLIQTLDSLAKKNRSLHILGLLSPGGIHSHESHIHALVYLADRFNLPKIHVHAFLDGRDTPPKSALPSINALESVCKMHPRAHIASLCGRYYAMDRDKRFPRTQLVYELLTEGKAPFSAKSAELGLEAQYALGLTDEFIKPCIIEPFTPIADGDAVFFMNFRADRARQLSQALVNPDFTGFPRKNFPKLSDFVTLTEYEKDLPALVVYPQLPLKNTLGEYLQDKELTQLRIAETEKYAHVTFFLNGGHEAPYRGEDRLLIPSPPVATYDLCPEMSAIPITDKVVEAIQNRQYDVIICNFANADMLGHTGNFEATVKAIETLDNCLGRISEALESVGGEAIITSDHGNADYMFDNHTNQPHTAHTHAPAPFLYLGGKAKILFKEGSLADIAPSLLTLLGLAIPKEMTGKSLLELT